MKRQNIIIIVLTMLFSMVDISVSAHVIEAPNGDGKTIYYDWANDNQTELAVSFEGRLYETYSDRYSGDVVIPERVNYNGTTYPVTSIADHAMFNCPNLTSVTIPNSVTSIGAYAFYVCSGLTSIDIPNSVTSIGECALYGTGATSVTIGNSLASIGNNVFNSCSGTLTINSNIPDASSADNSPFRGSTFSEVIFGDEVTSIGSYAFNNYSSLTSLIIGNSVTSIGRYAFNRCSGLTTITLPNSLKSIGAYAFSGTGITSITLPCTMTTLEDRAFSGLDLTSVNVLVTDYAAFCSNVLLTQIKNKVKLPVVLVDLNGNEIKQFVVPEGVTTIGHNAFYNCTGLTSLTLATTVTEIGILPFGGCTNLPGVKIPATDLAALCNSRVFLLMNSEEKPIILVDGNGWEIRDLNIPSSVTSIGDYAFANCTRLRSVNIGNTVTSIGDFAFNGCTDLTTINVANAMTSIGQSVFMNTAWFDNQPDGVVYIGKVALLYKGIMPDNTSITLLEGTVGIASSAFNNASCLTSITIPNSVKSIGDNAFSFCSMLTSIDIPSSVTAIGNMVFNDCSSLTSIVIPNSVTSIGDGAFCGCNGLTSLTIPSSVTSIGVCAFQFCDHVRILTIGSGVRSIGTEAFSKLPDLTDVYCYAENVPVTDSYAFRDSNFGATLHVPTASEQAYSRTEPWTYFANIEGGVETKKCATPTIAFVNDKLSFTCETEGVQFVYSMSSDDIRTNDENDNALANRFRVSVYATKEGYTNSNVASLDITYNGKRGDVNGDGLITISDAVGIVDIILGGNGPEPETHEYVDLQLPSGTLWATCNIGADSPEEYGDYFAWGETVPYDENGKTSFDWSTYQWCSGSPTTLSKYNPSDSFGVVDNLTELEIADDAASANWGAAWSMPTKEQFDELINSSNSTVEWTQENNVYGCKITSNRNGKSIFLPAAGDRSYSMLGYAGSKGYYWSNTLGSDYPYDSYCLNFDSSGSRTDSGSRFEGRSIRPVRASTTSTNP